MRSGAAMAQARQRLFAECARYALEDALGAGATGTVYRAFDRRENRHVAIKVLSGARDAFRSFRAQLEQLERIRHPSLVELFDVGSEGDTPYLVMELVEGEDLLDHVRSSNGDGFDGAKLKTCMAGLVGALSTLHRHALVHRDVKPSNIRVRADGTPVLLDYGILAHLEDLGASNAWAGTPAYMAPEQASGFDVGPSADFYALGSILFEILTGRPPNRTRGAKVLSPKEFELPKDAEPFSSLCRDLLSHEPVQRPTPRQILRRLGLPQHAAKADLAPALCFPQVFVGRTSEITHCLVDIALGVAEGCWLHVVGAEGSGKSALLDHVRDAGHVRHPSLVSLYGSFRHCDGQPYGALHDVVGQLVPTLMDHPEHLEGLACEDAAFARLLFPSLDAVHPLTGARALSPVPDPVERLLRAGRFTTELLRHVARHVPLLVCIEDLDCMPDDAASIVADLLAVRTSGLTVLTTGESSTSERLPSSRNNELQLKPLAVPHVEVAAQKIWYEAVADGVAPTITEPQKPAELISLLRDHLIARSQGEDKPVFEARIATLPTAAERILALASVSHHPFLAQEIAVAANLDPKEFRVAFDLLRSRGLIVAARGSDVERRYHVDSRLTARQCLAQHSEHLGDLHENFARALSGDVHANYRRFLHANDAGQHEIAHRLALAAAEEAQRRLAFKRVASLLDHVTDRSRSQRGEARCTELQKLGDALALAGRPEAAADAFARAEEHAGSAARMDFARRRVELLFQAARLGDGFKAARAALSALGLGLPKTSRRALLSLLFWRAMLMIRGIRFRKRPVAQVAPLELMRVDAMLSISIVLGLVDAFRGLELQTRALFSALRCGEPTRLARALLQEAYGLAARETPPLRKARKLIKRAEKLLDEHEDPYARGLAAMVKGLIEMLESKQKPAQDFLLEAERIFGDECTNASWLVSTCRAYRQQLLLVEENWPELRALNARGLIAEHVRGNRLGAANLTVLGGYLTHLMDDDARLANHALEQARRAWTDAEGALLHHYYETQALSHLGAWSANYATVERFEALHHSLDHAMLTRVPIVSALSRRARAHGHLFAIEDGLHPDPARGLRMAEQTAEALERHGVPFVGHLGNLLAASVATYRGDKARALSLLERAMEGYRSAHRSTVRIEIAHACLRGDEVRARELSTRLQEQGVSNVLDLVRADLPMPRATLSSICGSGRDLL